MNQFLTLGEYTNHTNLSIYISGYICHYGKQFKIQIYAAQGTAKSNEWWHAHCIIVTFNSAAGYDKNKKGIEHKDAKS